MDNDKRQQIVVGVWQVIAQGGIAAVSVRSVAAAAGVSAGRVQHYFATKTDLVRASVELLLDAAAEANPSAQGDPGDPQTLERLLLHALVPASSSKAGTSIYYCYIAASVADPWIAEALADAKTGLVDAVRECLEVQHPGTPDPAAAAQHLVLLADGATQAAFLGVITADAAEALVRSAMASVLSPGS